MRNGHYITDYHCHSTASPDGHNTMLELARVAADAGVDEMCFTDHIETLPWLRWNEPPLQPGSYDWGAMLRQFDEAQRAMGGRIRLRMGAEVGEGSYFPSIADSFLAAAPTAPDFVIGSIHISRMGDGTFVDPCRIETGDVALWNEVAARYVDELDRLLDWGNFHVIGHLTLPGRYAKEHFGIELDFDRYEEQLRAVLRRTVETGHGIELNTNRGHDPIPGEKLLRIYRELGGEIITLGSDAHTPQHLACAMERGQELLRSCGFRYFAAFVGGKPEFHKL